MIAENAFVDFGKTDELFELDVFKADGSPLPSLPPADDMTLIG